jgi:metal-sulfur cluster biosynthetic enzyme
MENEKIYELLKDVIDPELGINIVDLGLIYDLKVIDDILYLEMTLTSAACPLQDVIIEQINNVLFDLYKKIEIKWVFLPPWSVKNISSDGRDQLRSIGYTL